MHFWAFWGYNKELNMKNRIFKSVASAIGIVCATVLALPGQAQLVMRHAREWLFHCRDFRRCAICWCNARQAKNPTHVTDRRSGRLEFVICRNLDRDWWAVMRRLLSLFAVGLLASGAWADNRWDHSNYQHHKGCEYLGNDGHGLWVKEEGREPKCVEYEGHYKELRRVADEMCGEFAYLGRADAHKFYAEPIKSSLPRDKWEVVTPLTCIPCSEGHHRPYEGEYRQDLCSLDRSRVAGCDGILERGDKRYGNYVAKCTF